MSAELHLSEEDERDLQTALHCADTDKPDEVGHWPTVAGLLAAEVRRLRAVLAEHPADEQRQELQQVGATGSAEWVERVAEAMYTAREWSGCAGSGWANLPKHLQDEWRGTARAVLAVLDLPEATTEWGIRLQGEERVYSMHEDAARRIAATPSHIPRHVVRRARITYTDSVTEWVELDPDETTEDF